MFQSSSQQFSSWLGFLRRLPRKSLAFPLHLGPLSPQGSLSVPRVRTSNWSGLSSSHLIPTIVTTRGSWT